MKNLLGSTWMVGLLSPDTSKAEGFDSEIDIQLGQLNVERLKITKECEKCDLRGAVLNNVNLESANLKNANLKRLKLMTTKHGTTEVML